MASVSINPPPQLDPRLTDRTHTVWLELTSRCNLRCTYCHQSTDSFEGKDMEIGEFPHLVEQLKQLGVREVVAQGRGETHFLNGWHGYVRHILDAGIAVSGVMNLAKDYSVEEFETLARYQSITVSVDSVDRDLTRNIRRSSDIRQILTNQQRIVATALARNQRVPRIIWNCVTNDQVVFGLLDWMAMGISLGVSEFNLALLSKFTHIADALNVDHVTSLPDDRFLEAIDVLERAVALGRQHRKTVSLHPGLEESLLRHRQKILGQQPKSGDGQETAGAQLANIATPQPGQTRHCLYPWSTAYIEADRSLRVCCISPTFKHLSKEWDLAETINGPELQRFRSDFLQGKLARECAQCPTAAITGTETLKAKVEMYLAGKCGPHAHVV